EDRGDPHPSPVHHVVPDPNRVDARWARTWAWAVDAPGPRMHASSWNQLSGTRTSSTTAVMAASAPMPRHCGVIDVDNLACRPPTVRGSPLASWSKLHPGEASRDHHARTPPGSRCSTARPHSV